MQKQREMGEEREQIIRLVEPNMATPIPFDHDLSHRGLGFVASAMNRFHLYITRKHKFSLKTTRETDQTKQLKIDAKNK